MGVTIYFPIPALIFYSQTSNLIIKNKDASIDTKLQELHLRTAKLQNTNLANSKILKHKPRPRQHYKIPYKLRTLQNYKTQTSTTGSL